MKASHRNGTIHTNEFPRCINHNTIIKYMYVFIHICKYRVGCRTVCILCTFYIFVNVQMS